jgi:hypothetical protein
MHSFGHLTELPAFWPEMGSVAFKTRLTYTPIIDTIEKSD